MSRLSDSLPAIQKPSVMEKIDLDLTTSSYYTWIHAELIRRGGEETRQQYTELSGTLLELRRIPLGRRIPILFSQPAREKIVYSFSDLQQKLGADFLPLEELEAEILNILAEVADCLYRANENPERPDISEVFIEDRLGIKSLEETSEAYKIACAKYAKLCLTFLENNQSDHPNVGIQMLGILYDQWVCEYLGSLSRHYLMLLAKRLRQIAPDTLVSVASTEEVLPHLITHPELRDSIDHDAAKLVFTDVIDCYFKNSTNDCSTGSSIFVNLSIIATILGDATYARRAIRIAREFCPGKTFPEIVRMEALINMLNPHVLA